MTTRPTWTILIVDDSAEDRAEIRRLLLGGIEHRLTLREAADGAQGIALHAGVDCMVLDNRLPDIDALGVLTRLREGLEPGAPLPVAVLILTGLAETDSMRELQRAGAMDYLGKDWMTERSLAHAVESAITRMATARELFEVRAEAAAALRRAEHADRCKSEFLARMSHDVRTPMAAILGYADVLAGHVEDPEASEFVEIIRRSGQGLIELVDEVLDLSRVESGTIELERVAFSPEALLRDVVDLLRLAAERKGIELVLELPDPLPARVAGDSARLRQVLANLVGNAVKFTDEGSVRIVARHGGAARPTLGIEVVDTGPGIAPAAIPTLFDPFVQADASVVHSHGGSGLGLAICRRLVRLMGGDITLDSALGEGSRFALTVGLPILADRDGAPGVPAGRTPPAAGDPRALAGRRVLVVDDDDNVRGIVERCLRECGATVCGATDGLEGFEALTGGGGPYDAMVLDMQMPGIDGFEVARRLRARGSTLPVLALTASAMAGDRERCLAAGCDDYLSKPASRDALVAALATLVDGRRPHGPMTARRVLLVDDSETSCRLLTRILSRRGHDVRHALDCASALETAREFVPEVVVSDLCLPDGDGADLARRLREALPGPLRIIALTGLRAVSETERGAFDERLLKPVPMDELARLLEAA